jgi:hypothetical protein
MQDLEPYYNWRNFYVSEEDVHSPFYGLSYNEFQYTNQIYNHYIHPMWDDMGSPTLFLKIIFADYHQKYAIIELMGEWNDCLHNDIMFLKREVIDILLENGIDKFILIGENVLNFHFSDDCYYEEWFEEIEDGWIAMINFRDHVLQEFNRENLDYFVNFGGQLDNLNWRPLEPEELFNKISKFINKRLINSADEDDFEEDIENQLFLDN